ncbi:amidophosphoribosyltransferase [Lentiprolixibacter aurantiacus]|uniref:Amidophosphoribosyltransferase n=1 Tax=Lentiprolixibacter aurantiacus TaxID=2993939 RepID=A0AAE3MIW4_9FLAO|nr:amidophosphoribosyltransferase [Lentiprolixibacter aurantiacus]MCX2718391.1 amidophosphoribosyltransferase [Lentiprolixibacter aurantiacus]
MSDSIKHECGISLIRLLKPLEYYREKYGSIFYGINKMYLMMEKQHNRGQDGAGFASLKLDMSPGERYMSRVRSAQPQPIQDIFDQINNRINNVLADYPEIIDDVSAQKSKIPYVGEVLLGHVRYGTFGKNSIESVHPFLRQNNWMHRNLIVAGNFNMTNVSELFDNLVQLGQHPKEMADTVTVMEKIGHFLDDAVAKLYKQIKKQGYTKMEASALIAERIQVTKILKKAAKNWDGGYAMAGMLGHGDAFVLRDPAGIRPAYYYQDEEVVVVASERPAIQTVFNTTYEQVSELPPGNALIIKKDGKVSVNEILRPLERKACSFERIYFSRGNDKEIYEERKALGRLIFPKVLESVQNDLRNTVFSYIPNTAETSFLGMIREAQSYLNEAKEKQILELGSKLSPDSLREILAVRPRIEKVAIKDAKLRTFITQDSSRDDLVAHVYDISYGSVKPKDNLVIIDDSIVRGTTLKKSILGILDRLEPKKIVVVSSAPQIRYPDCYGIDMAKLEDFIAFRAALALHKERNSMDIAERIYQKCKESAASDSSEVENHVKEFYAPFTAEEISAKIGQLLSPDKIKAEVQIIYQTIENLHQACPGNLGDWYFTGNYPTPGGNRVVNRAFINFYEGKNQRAY